MQEAPSTHHHMLLLLAWGVMGELGCKRWGGAWGGAAHIPLEGSIRPTSMLIADVCTRGHTHTMSVSSARMEQVTDGTDTTSEKG